MNYTVLDKQHIAHLSAMVGHAHTVCDEKMKAYAHDETEDLVFMPALVLKPANTLEISRIMTYCNEHVIPLTPRAAGTGLSGGALPVKGGVLLSVERLNRILYIDERNLQVSVEPGVITEVLQNAVKEKGLFYPPDPASKGSCFIGGNIAENSGGPKAVKYGVVKDYVLNLEVVLPNGEIIQTGANVLKNATGYNLTQLMVGSEGTLGIVTKIVLRLIPYPRFDKTMLVPFQSADKACEAVSAIFHAGITPSGLEFMEKDALQWAADFTGITSLPLGHDIEAHLLIEVDGNDEDVIMRECEKISGILESFHPLEILLAETAAQKEQLWALRRKVAEAVKARSVYKEEDTVVPRAELPELLAGVKKIGKEYGFHSVCYGHAGDGNLHINILKNKLSDSVWNEKLPLAIQKIFILVKRLGGTLSGEHGIGLVQRNYMPIQFSPVELQLMKQIKNVFDPNHILNPGKIFPD